MRQDVVQRWPELAAHRLDQEDGWAGLYNKIGHMKRGSFRGRFSQQQLREKV